MQVRADGQVLEDRFILVCASNTEQAGGGLKLAPGARVDDGLLNLNLIADVGKLQAMKLLARVRRGKHIPDRKIRYLTASQLAIETATPVLVAADGEILGETPARVEIVRAGLMVWR